jgi:ribosomal-protein-alanine N-acetyltransferase
MPYILENMTYDDISQVANIERLCFSMPWPTSAYRRELKTPNTNRYIVARFIPPEIAVERGMRRPTAEDLTVLSHPELHPQNGHEAPLETEHRSRSLLSTLLPWLRNPANGSEEVSNGSGFPLAGYAGLWLMVDEAHITTIGVHPDHRGQGVGELIFLGLADLATEMRATRLTLEVRVSNITAQNLYRKYGLEVTGVRKRYYSDNGEDAYIMWSKPVLSAEFQERIAILRAELAQRLQQSFTQTLPPRRPIERVLQ